MPDIFQRIKQLLGYEDQVRRFPSRGGIRATIGKRRRYKSGAKYRGKRLNKARECARRRKQSESGMIKVG